MAPDSGRMLDQLVLHEGRARRTPSGRYVPYRDTRGILTIGVGRNLDQRGLSRAEVDVLLDNDVAEHWDELARALPWVERLDEVRQRVLLDMAFNLGVPGLLKFRQTLAAVERGDYWLASVGMMDSLWATQVGDGIGGRWDRAERLAEMMRTGEDYTR